MRSFTTRAAAAVFQQAHIPYFSAYGVHPDITKEGNWAFRGVQLGQPQGKGAAKFIADKFGKVNIIVFRGPDGRMQVEQVPLPDMPDELKQIIAEMK